MVIKNKKGFELAINTIILLILGVLVLIVLVIFLTTGFGNFGETIKSYFSYSNVDKIVSGCNILVDSDSAYNFCCSQQNVKYYYANKSKAEEMLSCSELAKKDFSNNRINNFDCEDIKCS